VQLRGQYVHCSIHCMWLHAARKARVHAVQAHHGGTILWGPPDPQAGAASGLAPTISQLAPITLIIWALDATEICNLSPVSGLTCRGDSRVLWSASGQAWSMGRSYRSSKPSCTPTVAGSGVTGGRSGNSQSPVPHSSSARCLTFAVHSSWRKQVAHGGSRTDMSQCMDVYTCTHHAMQLWYVNGYQACCTWQLGCGTSSRA
jgi:hypothetical protein